MPTKTRPRHHQSRLLFQPGVFQVDGKPLAAAAKRLAPLAAKRHTQAQVSVAPSGKLSIRTGLTDGFTAEINSHGTATPPFTPFTVTVEALSLLNAISAHRNDHIVMSRDATSFTLKSELGHTTLTHLKNSSPSNGSQSALAQIGINGPTLTRALTALSRCAAAHATRWQLSGVLIRIQDQIVTLATTDGIRIARQRITCSQFAAHRGTTGTRFWRKRHAQQMNSFGDKETLVSAHDLALAAEAAATGATILAITPTGVTLRTEDNTILIGCNQLAGEYPPLETIIAQHDLSRCTQVTVESDTIRDALKAIRDIANIVGAPSTVLLRCDPRQGALTVEATGDAGSVARRLPARMLHGYQPAEAHLSIPIFADGLEVCDASLVTISLPATDRAPVGFAARGSHGGRYWAMPIITRNS